MADRDSESPGDGDPTMPGGAGPSRRGLDAVALGPSAGMWYTWWAGDRLPRLAPPPRLDVLRLPDAAHVAEFTDWHLKDAQAYVRAGNAFYVAYLGGIAVAYGSSAAKRIAIGELDLVRPLPPRNRYLWGFVTESPWRGHGIYPRLLRAIVAAERRDAERFWIGHESANLTSGRGILKAGFTPVGELFFLPTGGLGLVAIVPGARAEAGAAILGARVLASG
jgi:RimJ/RimL family protein N-acetyltransferase